MNENSVGEISIGSRDYNANCTKRFVTIRMRLCKWSSRNDSTTSGTGNNVGRE